MGVMSEQTVKVTKNPTKIPHITSIKAFVSWGRCATSQEKIKITAKKPQKENEKKSRNNISLNRIQNKGKHARLKSLCVCVRVCMGGLNESGIQIKTRRSCSNCCGGLMSSQNPWHVDSFFFFLCFSGRVRTFCPTDLVRSTQQHCLTDAQHSCKKNCR